MGHGLHSSKLVVIVLFCHYLCCSVVIVLYYCYLCCSVIVYVVLCIVCMSMCTVPLPPCVYPIAVDKYININISNLLIYAYISQVVFILDLRLKLLL